MISSLRKSRLSEVITKCPQVLELQFDIFNTSSAKTLIFTVKLPDSERFKFSINDIDIRFHKSNVF